jgi:hypothetical protein
VEKTLDTFITKVNIAHGVPILSILTPFASLPHYVSIVGGVADYKNSTAYLSPYMMTVRKWLVQVEQMQDQVLDSISKCKCDKAHDTAMNETYTDITSLLVAIKQFDTTYLRPLDPSTTPTSDKEWAEFRFNTTVWLRDLTDRAQRRCSCATESAYTSSESSEPGARRWDKLGRLQS